MGRWGRRENVQLELSQSPLLGMVIAGDIPRGHHVVWNSVKGNVMCSGFPNLGPMPCQVLGWLGGDSGIKDRLKDGSSRDNTPHGLCAQPAPAVGFQELPSVLEDHGEWPQLATSACELAFGGRGHFLLEKSFEFSVLKSLWFLFLNGA